MPAPPADARSMLCEVIAVDPCGSDGILLRVRYENQSAGSSKEGQWQRA